MGSRDVDGVHNVGYAKKEEATYNSELTVVHTKNLEG
ncbi:hypothetical protein ECH_0111 [Ehrlichia chaffeensis str. Arkansas]|uniref:Uncharacterized protein n=1 Tax=Ehrlichia chaffeensis (strain ATCC CRL-10679 / Arkansas) TaxID=205920 RepID=Q2GHZ4_EHRCR|nr:hypothetical protein ECH_0111 [Ehrlichia chaffeensis str. Arkansas]